MAIPSIEAPSQWAEFGLGGLVIGTLFVLVGLILWFSYKERAESRKDFRDTLDKVAAQHGDAVRDLAGEIKNQGTRVDATLREFNATIAEANRHN